MTCWPASAVSVRLPPRIRRARSPMKSLWSGCGDCGSFGSCPPPGSASATRAPNPGRAQVPRPTGPFPAGDSEPSRPPQQGTGTPRPGLGALGCPRRGAGVGWGVRSGPASAGRSARGVHQSRRALRMHRCRQAGESGRRACRLRRRIRACECALCRRRTGPQNMHDGHVARPGDARSRSTRVTH